MAFITSGQTVLSFAEYQDVVDRDQRLFDANEGLTDDVVEGLLIRATERILTELRASKWWQDYYMGRSTNQSFNTVADVPALDAARIVSRKNDFTDLCVFKAMGEYILPKIADFGNEENAERQKMGYYAQRASQLFGELITAGDWYDFDDDGTIASGEKSPGVYNLRRVR
jgi:hypothetical protein